MLIKELYKLQNYKISIIMIILLIIIKKIKITKIITIIIKNPNNHNK